MIIKLKSDEARVYLSRGISWLNLGQWEKAKTNLIIARDMGEDVIISFHNNYESVADSEQQNNVKLTEDLAAMLTQE